MRSRNRRRRSVVLTVLLSDWSLTRFSPLEMLRGGAVRPLAVYIDPFELRRADVRKHVRDLDLTARAVLVAVPAAVLRDDAVVRRSGRAGGGDARTNRCGDRSGADISRADDPDAGRERLIVGGLELSSGHALVAVVGVARREVRVGRRRCAGDVV